MVQYRSSIEIFNKNFLYPFLHGIDSRCFKSLNWIYSPYLVPNMSNNGNKNEALIKFVAPYDLKQALQQLANERNISLSSLLRLIASEYVKRNRQP